MHWLKLPLAVLVAVFLLTSCSSSRTPETALPRPLPAALEQPCPAPVETTDNSPDAIVLTLKRLYDQYGICAGLHWETLRHLQKD